MQNYFSSDFKLGILGGGQLGKMLLVETRKLDIHTCVLDPSADAPARLACNEFTKGNLMDFDTIYKFGKQVDVLTIEIEHVNADALERLENEGIKVYPSSKTLKIIQDKGQQKNFYQSKNIPTAPFQLFENLNELKQAKLSFPFVWKSTRFGYDGKGVSIIKEKNQLDNLPNQPCIAEKLIPFEKELAVIVARNKSGEMKSYPVVEMEFHPVANLVEFVIAPARIEKQIANKAQAIALEIAEKINLIGILAVELFLTSEGNILVNEIAPRTHNSGHFSIEASFTSQFEQHLRAVLNLPLGSTKNKISAVMFNLVGAENHTGKVKYQGIESILEMEGVSAHFYGKKETRPFRKMGHVTVIDENAENALKKARLAKKQIQVIT